MTPRRDTLVRLAAIAAPAGAFLAVRLLMVGGPASAGGATPHDPFPAPARTTALTPEQQAAIEWLRSADAGAADASPFTSGRHAPPADPATPEETLWSDRFRLTGVTGGPTERDALASINGRVYTLGAEVSPGVTLVRIEARRREVELRLPDGRLIRLSEHAPR